MTMQILFGTLTKILTSQITQSWWGKDTDQRKWWQISGLCYRHNRSDRLCQRQTFSSTTSTHYNELLPTYLCLTGIIFQSNSSQKKFSQTERLGDNGSSLLQTGCSYCHPTNSSKSTEWKRKHWNQHLFWSTDNWERGHCSLYTQWCQVSKIKWQFMISFYSLKFIY